jgi:hypothetical protein
VKVHPVTVGLAMLATVLCVMAAVRELEIGHQLAAAVFAFVGTAIASAMLRVLQRE